MKRILAIRPEPGLSATLAAGRDFDLEIRGFPLSRIEAVEWEAPPAHKFDGLLIGSGNALRHGGDALDAYTALPVLAVGEATAQIARAHGFTVEKTGSGGLQTLIEQLSDGSRHLLRLTGFRNVPLDPPCGIRITERIVYRSVDLPMDQELISDLRGKSLVLLHSAGAAEQFAVESDRCGIARDNVSLAALGPRILDAAGRGWADARSAVNPSENALLALAREMCK